MEKSSSNNATATKQSSVRNDGLTPSQERAVAALLSSRSVAAAARQAGVGETSLRRWLREDPNFQNKLRGLRQQVLSHAVLELQQAASKAVATLCKLVVRDKCVEPARASLDYAFRSNIYSDVMDRLKILERNQAAEPKR